MKFHVASQLGAALTATLAIFPQLGTAINNCGNSNEFENQSSGGSPKVTDCQQLSSNIQGAGRWYIDQFETRTIAWYGTCAFIATSTKGNKAKVGNDDVRDLIADAIRQFSWNGLVGAKGSMLCEVENANGFTDVDWAIYHT